MINGMDLPKLPAGVDLQRSRKAMWNDESENPDTNANTNSNRPKEKGNKNIVEPDVIPEFVTFTWKLNSFLKMLKYKTSLLLQSQGFTSKCPTMKLTGWHLSLHYIPELGNERIRIGIFFDRLKYKHISKTVHANVTIYLTDIRDHAVTQIGSTEREFEIATSSTNFQTKESTDNENSVPEISSGSHEWFKDVKLNTILLQKDILLRDNYLRIRADIRVECLAYPKSLKSKSNKMSLSPGPPKVEENLMAMPLMQTEIIATTKKLEDLHTSDFEFRGGKDTQTIFQAKSYFSDYSMLTTSGQYFLDLTNSKTQNQERQKTININPVPEIIHDVNQVKHKLTLTNIGSTSTLVEMLVKPDPDWKFKNDGSKDEITTKKTVAELLHKSFPKSRAQSANARVSYNHGNVDEVQTEKSNVDNKFANEIKDRPTKRSKVPVQYIFKESKKQENRSHSRPKTRRKSKSRNRASKEQDYDTSSEEDQQILSRGTSCSGSLTVGRKSKSHRPRSSKAKDKENNNIEDSSVTQRPKLRVQSAAVDEVNRANTESITVWRKSKSHRPWSSKAKDKENNNIQDSSISQRPKLRVQSAAVGEVNRANTDVIIICADSKQFRVHSDVISSSSPVLSAMISKAIKSGKKNETPKIFSPEDSPEAMKYMFDFLYNGTINVIYEDEDDPYLLLKPMSATRCHELLETAERYQVVKFRDAILSNMLEQINLANAAQFAILAHKYGSNNAKITNGIRGFLRKRWLKLQEQQEFRDAVSNNPDAFLYCLQQVDEPCDEQNS